MTTSTRIPDCQAALDELRGGLASLVTALFFLAWSEFDLAILLVGAAPLFFGRRFFSRTPVAEPAVDPLASRSGIKDGDIAWSWRLLAQISLVTVLAILAAARLVGLSSGSLSSTAGLDIERWLPFAISSLIPLWFVISGLLNRLPRHLLAGVIGLAGAATGPLLALAWRDSLALAAAVTGLVLIADGAIARHHLCESS